MIKLLLFLFLFLFQNIYGSSYPADATDRLVNVYTSLQTLNPGDYVSSFGSTQGLCWFKAGINIATSGSSGRMVNFASPIGVDREIFLSNFCLNIQKDLILTGSVRIARSGNMSCGTGAFAGSSIILTGPLDLGSYTITCTFGQLTIDGNGNTIDFTKGGGLNADTTSTVYIRNAILNYVSSTNLCNNGTLALENVVMRLAPAPFIFYLPDRGLNIYGDVIVTGTGSFYFSKSSTRPYYLSIFNNGRIYFDSGVNVYASYNARPIFNLYGTKTGTLHFNNNPIFVGFDFTMNEGHIIFEDEITLNDSGSGLNGRFIVGPNCAVDMLGNARIVLENTTTFSIL